jgi:uncharacterized repeat protein (TIGR01451 family)
MNEFRFLVCIVVAALIASSAFAGSDQIGPSPQDIDLSDVPGIDTITIRLKVNAKDVGDKGKPMSKATAQRLSNFAGVRLAPGKYWFNGFEFVRLPRLFSEKEADVLVARMKKHPEIQDVDRPGTGEAFLAPSDPQYPEQWSLRIGSLGSILAEPAWSITTGDPKLTVAIIDFGILPLHPELSGRIVQGWDFLTNINASLDGNGPDNDPTEEGNWVTAVEAADANSPYFQCPIRPTSYFHGTGVAGVFGSNANNGASMAGVNWNSKILPLRVLGKCSKKAGFSSTADFANAMLWAVGAPGSGVPMANNNKARVLNMSFGGPGLCPPNMSTAISEVTKRRSVVVAATGNDNESATANYPANCPGVIAVASVTRQGSRSPDSNTGVTVAITAPGSFLAANTDRILSLSNSGATIPSSGVYDYAYWAGTSFAAPHVSGILSLMLSVNPKLTPAQMKTILTKSARPFPTGTSLDCTTATCGAGIADAGLAVSLAKSPPKGGKYHSVVVEPDASVWVWGFNGNGQTGTGDALGSILTSPKKITSLSNVRTVSAGLAHTLAVMNDGTVRSFGYNGKGQLCLNNTVDQPTPTTIPGLTNVIDAVAGPDYSVFLLADGTAKSCGYNFFGQLGVAAFDFNDRLTPTAVGGLTGVVSIAAAGKRSIFLKDDGTVWSSGDISNVSAGGTIASVSAVPLQMAGIADVVAIAAGGDDTTGVNVDAIMLLKYDGTVYMAGYNNFGQLGIGSFSTKFLATQVPGITTAIAAAVGREHSHVVLDDGTSRAWGNNCNGQLGNGSQGTANCAPPVFSNSPVQTSNIADAVDIAAGDFHVLALRANLTLAAYGSNLGGQLGDTTQTDRSTAVAVTGAGGTGTLNLGSTSTGQANLALGLSAPSSVQVGGNVAYTVTVQNLGPNTATALNVSIILSSAAAFVSASPGCSYAFGNVNCTIASLSSGGSNTLQITAGVQTQGSIDATAFVSSGVLDPNMTNNQAGVTTLVTAATNNAAVPTLPEWGTILLGALLLASTIIMSTRRMHGA